MQSNIPPINFFAQQSKKIPISCKVKKPIRLIILFPLCLLLFLKISELPLKGEMDYIRYLFGLITREELKYRRIKKQSVRQWLKDYEK